MLKKQVEANPDNAMMAMMQLIPMANQMLGGIMSSYGFNEENGGVMGFLNVLQGSDDDEAGATRQNVCVFYSSKVHSVDDVVKDARCKHTFFSFFVVHPVNRPVAKHRW